MRRLINSNIEAYIQVVCARYSSSFDITLRSEHLSTQFKQKLARIFNLKHCYPDIISDGVNLLDNQYQLFLSRLIDVMNKDRYHQSWLTSSAIETLHGVKLKKIYFSSEYVNFAIKDASKFLNSVLPPTAQRGMCGLEKVLRERTKR
ncbi:hypothetical protein [Gynuella sp.]|uniref:hypothetical protein n=1 Tax=Gynuella sp. TaxID=2969146 RepID=UPI003D0DB505